MKQLEPTPGDQLYEPSRYELSKLYPQRENPHADYGGHVINAALLVDPVTDAPPTEQLDLFNATEGTSNAARQNDRPSSADVVDEDGYPIPLALKGIRAESLPRASDVKGRRVIACGDCAGAECDHVLEERFRRSIK